MSSDELPVEVILSIQRVFDLDAAPNGSLDCLDDNFSPVDVLNQFFPNETSLGAIDAVQARLDENERELQREIDELQRELKRDQDPSRMLLIQEMISDLLGQMSLIREKATESEAVVRDITKDIQILDLAKKNLILSMTTLKRLQMLVNALTQLEDFVQEKNYPEIAKSLSAIKQLSPAFQSYASLPHIAHVWQRIRKVEAQIRTEIEGDFERFYMQMAPVPPATQLSAACQAVDILPPDLRTSLIARYVSVELKDYRRIFKVSGGNVGSGTGPKAEPNEAAALDNLERRFAWFRRTLGRHEVEAATLFPEDWQVGWALIGAFVDTTRDDMTILLSRAVSTAELSVKVLLDTLAIVAEFEVFITKKYSSPLQAILLYHATSPSIPPKPISAAFEPHMSVYVEAQDKALAEMLAPHLKPNKSRTSLESLPDAPPTTVLPSSTELFYVYGQTMEQSVKLGVGAGAGKALFDLATVWKKWLKVYAEDVLLPRLKRSTPSRKSMEARWDVNELKEACLVINTADYCSNTSTQLEEKVKEKIKEEYKEQVSLQAEKDIFLSVISTSINVLLTYLDTAIDISFNTMARTSYVTQSQVSGPSAWTGELVANIEGVVGVVKGDGEGSGGGIEGKKYVRNFLDKCASLVLARFTVALVKSRPLGEAGAEQLLIDLQAIKACLTKLPGESLTSASYTRGLLKTTARMEALLKVIVTPDVPAEGFILNYTLLISDASFSNFQKILDLKGTPKASQNDLLDSFLTITSTKSELASTSFLSSLDMDPSASSHLAAVNITSPNMGRLSLPLPNAGGENASAPSTGDSAATGAKGDQKREKFSDFKRFVSFGLRRDSVPPS